MFWKIILFIFTSLYVYAENIQNNNCIIINYSPSKSGKYIGSPSILILPNGDYLVSHDLFGPNANAYAFPKTFIYISKDKGKTWNKISMITPLLWGGDVYG